jgi:hypothetical protein
MVLCGGSVKQGLLWYCAICFGQGLSTPDRGDRLATVTTARSSASAHVPNSKTVCVVSAVRANRLYSTLMGRLILKYLITSMADRPTAS